MSAAASAGSGRRAPTLYAIVALKVAKGLILLLLAVGVLSLAGRDLPRLFAQVVRWIHLDPGNEFFSRAGQWLGTVTPANLRMLASGTGLYGLFLLVEGGGLACRVRWAAWMAIGESAFFIPIEIYKLMDKFSWGVFAILAVNVLIVWYLLQNRRRLFRYHHHG